MVVKIVYATKTHLADVKIWPEGYAKNHFFTEGYFFENWNSMEIIPVWEDIATLLPKTPHIVSIGCGRGEEVYSIAMLAREFSAETCVTGVDILAENITTAKRAIYPAQDFPIYAPIDLQLYFNGIPTLFQKYFLPENERWKIDQTLYDKIHFIQGDVRTLDMKTLHPDLIVCRNLFTDLTPPLQQTLWERFIHAAPYVIIDNMTFSQKRALQSGTLIPYHDKFIGCAQLDPWEQPSVRIPWNYTTVETEQDDYEDNLFEEDFSTQEPESPHE